MARQDDRWILLVSIRPEFATKIFEGTKRVELRRVRPRLKKGHEVLVYVSSPTKELQGAFEVQDVVEGSPRKLWREIGNKSGITREKFDQYFEGVETGYAICINHAWEFDEPQSLETLRQRVPKFAPPQSYHYLDESAATTLRGTTSLARPELNR